MAEDLRLPEGTTTEQASAALHRHLRLRDRGASERERTFYDTFDGLLHAEGMSAVHEAGELSLYGCGRAEEPRAAWASAPRRVLGIELDDGPLRDALVPVVGVRALLAQVLVRSRLQKFDVIDDAHKTVARITLEEPELIVSEHRVLPLGPRFRVTAVRGYEKALARTRRTLERELGLTAANRRLVDDALVAAGLKPAGISSKPSVELEFGQRTDAAVLAVLSALFEIMKANLEGTIADVDAEFLHDFRVAVRRSRTVQRELSGAFPAAELARLRAEFKWLQQATGDARDLDVYVLEFDALRALAPDPFAADLDPLLGVLRSHRLTARREMVRELRSDRAGALWRDWGWFLQTLVDQPQDDRPLAVDPIGEAAGARIAKVYRKMVKMGRAIDDSSPSEALHELRKTGKELRYLLELFGAELYPKDVVKPMVKTLKSLQDVLGRHQDREVQAATLRSLRGEVSALPGGPAALMAMGLLIERIGEDQQAARGELTERFAAFASKSRRKLVKETFA